MRYVGALLFGVILGTFFGWSFFHWVGIKTLAYNWQQLLGSLIGAATPLTLFFITESYQRKKIRKEFLLTLEKGIITAINNLSDVDRMLHIFLEVTLKRFENRVTEDNALDRHSVGQVFVPLSSTYTFDKEMIKETTGSFYLENLVLDIVSTSQEMPILLQDIGRQLDRTLSLNTQIALMKLNSYAAHNQSLLDNIEEFQKFLRSQTFGVNIPIYLRKLVQTLVALQEMNKLGLGGWKQKFNFPPPFSTDISQSISDSFKPEVNKRIGELQKDFQSKLLMLGEEPQYEKDVAHAFKDTHI